MFLQQWDRQFCSTHREIRLIKVRFINSILVRTYNRINRDFEKSSTHREIRLIEVRLIEVLLYIYIFHDQIFHLVP